MRYEVHVTPELVAQWVVTGAEIQARCLEGLPEGVRLVGCHMVKDWSGDGEHIRLYFDDAAGRDVLRRVDPVYQDIRAPQEEPR